jgi:hypothetical protein
LGIEGGIVQKYVDPLSPGLFTFIILALRQQRWYEITYPKLLLGNTYRFTNVFLSRHTGGIFVTHALLKFAGTVTDEVK